MSNHMPLEVETRRYAGHRATDAERSFCVIGGGYDARYPRTRSEYEAAYRSFRMDRRFAQVAAPFNRRDTLEGRCQWLGEHSTLDVSGLLERLRARIARANGWEE